MIKNIATYVAAQIGATVGENIFAIWEQPDAAIPNAVINERTGGSNWSGLRTQMVQIVVTGGTPFSARNFAYSIHNAIERKVNIAMGTTKVLYVDPVGPPMLLGRDPQGRFEFTANYVFRVIESTV